NDGDRSTVPLRIGRGELARVLREGAAEIEPLPACAPAARTDLDEVACGAGHNAAYVSSYGDVTPCVAMPVVCGNVRETPFAEVDAEDLLPALAAAAGPAAPPAVRRRLADALAAGRARHLLMTRALASVLARLAVESIPALMLKGPVLAETVYPEPAWRPF